jgi:hypothetical protein
MDKVKNVKQKTKVYTNKSSGGSDMEVHRTRKTNGSLIIHYATYGHDGTVYIHNCNTCITYTKNWGVVVVDNCPATLVGDY